MLSLPCPAVPCRDITLCKVQQHLRECLLCSAAFMPSDWDKQGCKETGLEMET